MSSTYLYAELLSNIRQVTLYASLKSYKNDDTKVELSSDRKYVTLSHDRDIASIILPSRIAGKAQLILPSGCANELSFRLEVAYSIEPRTVDHRDDDIPWPARALTATTTLKCRQCDNMVLKDSAIRRWKDLPTENWAEMMDFWHCHKPHDYDENNGFQSTDFKGYHASNKIEPEVGTGLVDVSSFLLAGKDCHGLKVLPNPSSLIICAGVLHSYSTKIFFYGQEEGDLVPKSYWTYD